MGTQYLVVSDFHLTDVEANPKRWKAYKRPEYTCDDEFADLVRHFSEQGASGDQLTLVLNGDIVDFDLIDAVPDDPPWPVSRAERKRGLDATEAKSVWKLERVLGHHPKFVATLADFVCAGHRLVYILGNHDRELHFPDVERVFIRALEEYAREAGKTLARGSIAFEPWFFYVPGELYAEHGHQYDYYTSFRYQLYPRVEMGDEEVLALPMGNLSNRYLINRMGYFNPFAADFILNFFSYAWHWFKHYAFTRRTLFFPWLFGSLAVVSRLFAMKGKLRLKVPPEHVDRLGQAARKFDLSLDEIQAIGQLQSPPITQRWFRLLRELWIDRALIAVVMAGGTIALALVPIPLWIKLMVPLSSFPLLFLIYEWFVRDESIFRIEKEIPERARAVSRVLPARVVTFGHTHVPRQIPLSKETTFVDTGTWAPIPCSRGSEELRPGYRNFLWLKFERRESEVIFGSWMSESRFPCSELPEQLQITRLPEPQVAPVEEEREEEEVESA